MRRTVAAVTAVAAFVMGCSVSAADNAASSRPSGARSYSASGRGGVVAAQTESEVAGATVRPGEREIVAEDERVPWYKGGLWRNRKGKSDQDDKKKDRTQASGRARDRDDDYDDYDDDPVAARKTGSAAPGARQAPRLMDDDPGDFWDDEDEYTGYNPDGSFGGRSAGRQAPPPPPAGNVGAPFDDAGRGGFAAGPDLYASDPTGFAGPVKTAGASSGNFCPPETYPDPYRTGQMSAYGPFDTSVYGGSDAYQPAPMAGNYDYATGNLVNGQSYPAQSYADPYADGYSAPVASGYPPPGYDSYTAGSVYQASPLPDQRSLPAQNAVYQPSSPTVQGGPQFENAVRMVKNNRFSEAKAILAAETSRNPSNAAAWRWLADCHYNLLELDDAIICYQQSLERDPNDYFALRGQGFSYLHRGHEYWRRMQEEVGKGSKEEAAATFALAHDDYKKSLELLGLCLRRNPTDGEAIFGEAMAAEGASRKLYSNALSYLKLGPGQRERAELFAENCLTVINKGIERSKERAKMNPGDAGPRALMGGLYLRKATLYRQLGKNDLALVELRNARDVQQSILEEIDKNNATARKSVRECEALWEQWGGNRS